MIQQLGTEFEILIDIPIKYRAKALTALFSISTKKAKEAIMCWVEYGTETAMNKFN